MLQENSSKTLLVSGWAMPPPIKCFFFVIGVQGGGAMMDWNIGLYASQGDDLERERRPVSVRWAIPFRLMIESDDPAAVVLPPCVRCRGPTQHQRRRSPPLACLVMAGYRKWVTRKQKQVPPPQTAQ